MRVFLVLLMLMPVLSGCETVKKGFRDITGGSEPEASRKAEPVASRKPEPEAARKPEPARSAESLLAAGVAQYEEGNYAQAQRLLQSSLAEGLPSRASQARAHKYLAFIDCTSGRKTQCRAEFAQALKIDPSFELEPSEAGHPLWGPVFRSLKQQQKPRR